MEELEKLKELYAAATGPDGLPLASDDLTAFYRAAYCYFPAVVEYVTKLEAPR